MKVIVTGAAGYIGGQTVLNLLDRGHEVIAIDRRTPRKDMWDIGCMWHIGDFAGEVQLTTIEQFHPDAIIHCAGTSLVGPSIMNPEEYYENNFVKTKIMLDYIVKHKLTDIRIIFSSSAATYGNPIMVPCQEVDPCEPISPYGESKLMIEWMLKRYAHAYGIDYVAFRYFNACGADHKARHGQEPGATHLIAKMLESVINQTQFVCNGNNYETADGTCVRDYVHVEDLTNAHILALDRKIPCDVYNLGTKHGASVLEIAEKAREITGAKISIEFGPEREGDPAVLTADPGKFNHVSGWRPKFNIQDIVQHAWNWYNRGKI